MPIPSLVQYLLFLALVTLLVRPAGTYLLAVFDGEKTWLDPLLGPVERLIYRLLGVDPRGEMSWRSYALAFVLFGVVGTLFLYALLMLQFLLPGGPQASDLTTPMTHDLAANTAVSFSTTTWQAYAGETTMKYWTQLIGLAG